MVRSTSKIKPITIGFQVQPHQFLMISPQCFGSPGDRSEVDAAVAGTVPDSRLIIAVQRICEVIDSAVLPQQLS